MSARFDISGSEANTLPLYHASDTKSGPVHVKMMVRGAEHVPASGGGGGSGGGGDGAIVEPLALMFGSEDGSRQLLGRKDVSSGTWLYHEWDMAGTTLSCRNSTMYERHSIRFYIPSCHRKYFSGP